jgi:mannose-6-phosphate isomerase
MSTLYPFLFQPVFKDHLWGGRNLERLGKTLPAGRVAESWEIAAHPDGSSVVENGTFAGQNLTQLHAQLGLDLIGTRSEWAQARGKFPLMVKLIDASQALSLQVHPDDTYAMAHEGNELGKTEMWVVLEAKPGAAVILGLSQATSASALRQAIAAGDAHTLLHKVPVKKGDVVCVPAGTLHAILEGVVIAEIQQNSNTTYRVFDWNRLQDGKPRALHVDKALDVINFAQVRPELCKPLELPCSPGQRREQLCANRYFVTERITLSPHSRFEGHCDGSTLEIWGNTEGSAHIHDAELPPLRFALLPASLGAYSVTAGREGCTLLRTYVGS